MSLIKRLNNLGNTLNENFYEFLLSIIAALNILPILAPLFAKLGWYWPAKVIYFIYSFFCHQLHWRSLHVCDHQYGWCSRCSAIWIYVLITGVFVKFFKVKNVKWYWLTVPMLPMALDGIVQTVATLLGFASNGEIYYMSNNLVRYITGSLFGIGFGLWVWTTLAENMPPSKQAKRKTEISALKIAIFSALITFILFILALLLWRATSPNYQPANFWDFAVKTPALPQEFLVRSKNTI